jgi:A/G-specific adenine glycosylase
VNRRAIAPALIAWYRKGHRDLPWRRTADPYRIWVSEIMLQQTRARAAVPYYERFLERFPAVDALAAADEDEVLALWSGLGYYARARNLLRAAREIAGAGRFPADFPGIRALPGVGDYTAAAIASIAYGLPHAVIDGNALRVAARLENDASDVAASRTRARLREAVESWLDRKDPGTFNQALMELGATVCLPGEPLCAVCPLARFCGARGEGTAAQLPVKGSRVEPVRIAATLLVVRRGGRVLLRRREDGARRMAGFWELPAPEELTAARPGDIVGEFRHTITHHQYTFTVQAGHLAGAAPAPFRWFDPSGLAGIPLSTTARKAIRIALSYPLSAPLTRPKPRIIEPKTPPFLSAPFTAAAPKKSGS